MTRLIAITGIVIFGAAAAWATTEVMDSESATVIEIEVSRAKMAHCRETLTQLALRPAVHDNGSSMLFDFSEDLPTVRCAVR